MPCEDVTESLQLRLDQDDRLAGYRLLKRTCGRAVGEESLLAMVLAGMHAEELLAMQPEALFDRYEVTSDEEEFLALKHLLALQGAIAVLLGQADGGPNDAVRMAAVRYGEELELEVDIVVEVLTEKIKSCGKCSGCGVLRKKPPAVAALA